MRKIIRKNLPFIQVLVGTAIFFVILSLLFGSTDKFQGESATIIFTALGYFGGVLILDGYYKLTGKLGLEKYHIEEEIVEAIASEESEIVNKKIRDVSLPPLVTVAMIEREGSLIPPRGDTEIKKGDQVILAGRPDVVRDVARIIEASR